MGVYIKNWSLADWKELLKWAKIGANNAMIGEFTEVEEVPAHGRLIDADKIEYVQSENGCLDDYAYRYDINEMPTIIQAEEEE